MATEMPIDPEFGRNIEGISGMQEQEDGSVAVDIDLDDSEIEELPDGSAVVKMDNFKGPTEDQDFYENLAESDQISSYDLDSIALRYINLAEKDKEARKLRDKQYEEGIRRTGMGNDAPGGANFNGASKVVHPVKIGRAHV